jgi:drug/metabolite transporter (DMT)-like permease
MSPIATRAQSDWKNNDDAFLIKFLSVSYMWYSGLGCILMVVFGLLFSYAVSRFSNDKPKLVNSTYISPPILRLWNWVLTKERMKTWIYYDYENEIIVDDAEQKS